MTSRPRSASCSLRPWHRAQEGPACEHCNAKVDTGFRMSTQTVRNASLSQWCVAWEPTPKEAPHQSLLGVVDTAACTRNDAAARQAHHSMLFAQVRHSQPTSKPLALHTSPTPSGSTRRCFGSMAPSQREHVLPVAASAPRRPVQHSGASMSPCCQTCAARLHALAVL